MTRFESVMRKRNRCPIFYGEGKSIRFIASALNILAQLDDSHPLTAHELSELTGEYGPSIGQRCRALRKLHLVKMVKKSIPPFEVPIAWDDNYQPTKWKTIDTANAYILI